MSRLRNTPTTPRYRYHHRNMPKQDVLFSQFMKFCEDEGQRRVLETKQEFEQRRREVTVLLRDLSKGRIGREHTSLSYQFNMAFDDTAMRKMFEHRDIEDLRGIVHDSMLLKFFEVLSDMRSKGEI